MRIRFEFIAALSLFLNFSLSAQAPVKAETNYGLVQGFHDNQSDLDLFLGIPFAKPPVGDLRWKAPQEPDEWQGIKKTTEFAAAPMQTNVFGDMVYRGKGFSEDCLYLNIWTPNASENKSLPVLVYFYGGGFVAGSGGEPRYDGTSLAQKGIVVVTVNYRLNIFGFYAHPALSAEAPYHASGNYGLLDQNAALKWVSENIENFGGDPEKITIGGESAGSISVSAQMASPMSKDYLAGAMGESGASIKPTLAPVPLSEAEKIGVEFMKKTSYNSIEDLRALSAEELYKVYQESGRFGFPTVIDHYFLPKPLPEIFRNGEEAQIPLLVGWNSAEVDGQGIMQGKEYNEENYKNKLKELYPENFEEVVELYPSGNTKKIRESATQLASDRFIAYSTWKWFDLHRKNSEEPVYRYLFKKIRPAAKANPDYTPIGAAHASEIEYFLGNLGRMDNPNLKEIDFKISDTIQQYLANFIKTGNPNGAGLPKWPSAEASDVTPPVLIMDAEFETQDAENDKRYLFLDGAYGNDE
ncbi:carboxylesterase [Christiangramia fulva]|uniref:Carboxylic ester hydrolase n=1 Tax=Christiangramia fulva TaxID=2126553 RepID=A0A2R3Z2M4_9FLAO|nr:carboxylesterase family protein [Christiangramia fulva]AVR44498.1 carboxylesterase [Christiangramia fulva]